MAQKRESIFGFSALISFMFTGVTTLSEIIILQIILHQKTKKEKQNDLYDTRQWSICIVELLY